MSPAFSVIFFTVGSGAGYGLLFWTAMALMAGWWAPGDTAPRIAVLAGIGLAAAGLLSSTFHLGHPERAWRALSQWRSSWLSREGVLALVSLPPALALAASCWLAPGSSLLVFAAVCTLLAAPAVVFSTAMIYASLKPIPRWSNPWVPLVYMAFSLASGATLALSCQLTSAPVVPLAVLALLVLAWLVKFAYWRATAAAHPGSDTGSATGLGVFGEVEELDPTHTGGNYVLREMGFVVARRHARRLRRLAVLMGLVVPAVALALAATIGGRWQPVLVLPASVLVLAGLLIERWLFFAEARHVVTVFFGSRPV